jgi:hypothetical protein
MPHVLHRRLELGQDEGAAAQEAPELEHPAPGRPEEQVVIEEAGVDRLLQEELIPRDIPIHEHNGDSLLVEHTWPFIGVGHLERGRAGHIAVDDEIVGIRARAAEEGVDRQSRFA